MGTEQSARAAAWLFIAAGVLTFGDAYVPGTQNATAAAIIGIVSVLVGISVRLAPWSRWSPSSTLYLVAPAFLLVAVGNRYGSGSPYVYATYFIVVFTWVGLSQPRRMSYALAPVAVAFYLVPLWGAGNSYPGAAESVLVAIPVCVLVGETVAWAIDGLRIARRDATHRANLLSTVAKATTSITALEWDNVPSGVVDAATSLGFELAALAMFDEASDTYELLHPRGMKSEYTARRHPMTEGIPGQVRKHRVTLASDRSSGNEDFMSTLEERGLQAAIGSPVWVYGHLAAVLVAATRAHMRVTTEDVEAFDLLAMHAGRALENARRFGDERTAKEQLVQVSLRDELTGVGNRRQAVRTMDELHPGDSVVIIDLDHFKAINDRHGHGTGDTVLIQLADHLRTQVRDPLLVSRYGGDEFLVVLVDTNGEEAVKVAERLVGTWHARFPMTSISAGVADQLPSRHPASTIADADTALYAAKRLGRNRVCHFNTIDELVDDASARP
jgi:diguanylate cyclase (GGDEF)-like protein